MAESESGSWRSDRGRKKGKIKKKTNIANIFKRLRILKSSAIEQTVLSRPLRELCVLMTQALAFLGGDCETREAAVSCSPPGWAGVGTAKWNSMYWTADWGRWCTSVILSISQHFYAVGILEKRKLKLGEGKNIQFTDVGTTWVSTLSPPSTCTPWLQEEVIAALPFMVTTSFTTLDSFVSLAQGAYCFLSTFPSSTLISSRGLPTSHHTAFLWVWFP